MATKWYVIPKSKVKKEPEIGSYEVCGTLIDLSRGVYLAYATKGLVTGISSKEEAERWINEGVYDEKTDSWTKCPAR